MAKFIALVEKDFILTQIQKLEAKVIIFGSGKIAEGKLKSLDKENIVVSTSIKQAAIFNKFDDVSVLSSHQGKKITFYGKVRQINAADITIKIPEKLVAEPQRNAIRVLPPASMKLEIYRNSEKISVACPESMEYIEPSIPSNLTFAFDLTSMANLLQSFKTQSLGLFTKASIIMFNDAHQPISIEEKLISEFGKILLITSMHSPLPSKDPYPDGLIITQSMAEDFEGPSIFVDGSMLDKSKIEKSMADIISEIYCPILYYQYVVGYIYIMNDKTKKSCLDYYSVDFAWEFSQLLAYNFMQTNYFKFETNASVEVFVPQLLDLSATGCLISVPKGSRKLRLKVGSVLDCAITVEQPEQKVIKLRGRVARHFDNANSDNYGVAFIGIKDETSKSLTSLIYSDANSCLIFDEVSVEL